MQKKVILFFPDTHRVRKDDAWCLPPFSLLAIAAPLVQEEYQVRIVDARVEPNYLELIQAEAEGSICLGISVLTGNQIRQALAVSENIKAKFPSLPVVWGGYHPTLLPEQTVSDPSVDIVVRGQGELPFRHVVQAVLQGNTLHGIPGIVFKENGRIVLNESPVFTDINQFSAMPFSLLDLRPHLPDLGFATRTVSYVSSQGCPHDCQFCAESIAYGRRWSGLSPQRVVNDLELLVSEYEVDGVIFVDNNFFVNEKRVQEICREIIRRGLKFRWAAQGRADRIASLSNETFDLLKTSGFSVFHVGAESGSDRVLQAVSKKCDRQSTVACAKAVKAHGLHISFGFIFGFPGETAEDIEQNFSLMEEVTNIQGAFDCIVHFYAPPPGTALLPALDCESSKSHSLREWMTYNTTDGIAPWITQGYVDRIRRRVEYFYPLARPNWMFKKRLTRHLTGRVMFPIIRLISRTRYSVGFYDAAIDWRLYKRFRAVL